MPEDRVQRRLAAILAADAVGYSRLMQQDEAATLVAMKALRAEVLDPKIAEHNGRVFKTTGDGVLAEFPSVVNAVACAVDIQRVMSLRSAGLPEELAIRLRIGINLGDVIVEGEDLFGDGVNVAARLESVAPPGEVAVSAVVRDQIGNRLDLVFEDMGRRTLKNIRDPVHVFRIAGTREPSQPSLLPESGENALSIAVLPLDNMSGIPEQDYIGESIAENIITDLSRFRDLTVIARNSSFAYKGRATPAQDIRRDLNVNYILEGSVQRAGDRIRITAQLIDGTSKHVWAERYDRKVDDLFAVMDDVTELIVGALGTTYGGRLRKAASEQVSSSGPRNFRAFDHFLKGMEELNRFTKESVAESIAHFSSAVAIDPKYAKAHAKIAWANLVNIYQGWSVDPDISFAKARDAANAAVRADDAEAWGYWALAGCAMHNRQHDRALSHMRRALELNPNDADVLTDMGIFCADAGHADEGLAFALKAMRMNPHHPEYYSAQLGKIYFDARQYDSAIRTIESIRTLNTPEMLVYLAASQAAVGHDAEARATAARLLASEPHSTISLWTNPEIVTYQKNSDRVHLADNLRKAGLPE